MRRLFVVLVSQAKRVFMAHYAILVHLTTPRSQLAAAEKRCAKMERYLFSQEG